MNAQGVDWLLDRDSEGVYDFVIENGQFKTINSFDTAFDMIIHCERRADASEVPLPQYRRGWFGNLLLNDGVFEIGSKLWLLQQERRTQETLNRAVDYVKQACQWLIDDGHLQDLTVSGRFISKGGIGLDIKYITLDNITESKYYEMWKNTGKQDKEPSLPALPNILLDYVEIVNLEDSEEGGDQSYELVPRVGGKLLCEDGTPLLLTK